MEIMDMVTNVTVVIVLHVYMHIKNYQIIYFKYLNVNYTLIHFLKGAMGRWSMSSSNNLPEGYYIWRLHNRKRCPKLSCKSVWQALHCWALNVGSYAPSTRVVGPDELLLLLPSETFDVAALSLL